MKKIFLFINVILIAGCVLDYGQDTRDIQIYNKSNNVFYCLKSQNDSLTDPYLNYKFSGIEELFKINKDSSIDLPDNPLFWEDYISESKDCKMRLFFIAKDTVDRYGWKEVLTKNIYTKVYLIDIGFLDKNDWKFVYYGK